MTIDNEYSVNVIIVGGSIAGASAAAYIAQSGIYNDILVVYKDRKKDFIEGETAFSAAMVMSNTDIDKPHLIKIAAAAMREYRNMKSILGIDPKIEQCGSILVGTTFETTSRMKKQVLLQNANGIPSRLVSTQEIHQLAPYLNVDGILCGIYCPEDGFVDQMTLVRKLREYAQDRGVIFWPDTTVTEITAGSEGVINIQTHSRGLIPAKRVVITAGAQSPELVKSFGNYPLKFSTRTLFEGTINYDLSTTLRIVEHADGPWQGYYFRPEEGGKRCIIGVGTTRENNQFPTGPQIPFNREETSEFMNINFPGLNIGELTGTAYPRAMGPNGLPYVGPIDREGKLIAFYGGSGYGITFSPFFARNVADLTEGRINREIESCLPNMERLYSPSRIECG